MATVTLSTLEAGHCFHPGKVVLPSASLKPIRFPSSVAVIDHPTQGIVLFDTGYSQKFHEETRHFPNRFYALITPVTIDPEQTAARQLAKLGVRPQDVSTVVLSHFHADHVAGASDFPKAKYIYLAQGYDVLKNLGDFGALKAGFLRGLLPSDFESRSQPLESGSFRKVSLPYPEFQQGWDLMGDETVIAVELPGHAVGHIGLLVRSDRGEFLLAGDACWLDKSYQNEETPSALAQVIFSDRKAYRSTLKKISSLSRSHPDLKIIPCHCEKSLELLPKTHEVLKRG